MEFTLTVSRNTATRNKGRQDSSRKNNEDGKATTLDILEIRALFHVLDYAIDVLKIAKRNAKIIRMAGVHWKISIFTIGVIYF